MTAPSAPEVIPLDSAPSQSHSSTPSSSSEPNDPHQEAPTSPIAVSDKDAGAVPNRKLSISISNHPLFAAKARGLRTRIMRFTPSWFSVTMGTGIVNTLLFDLPWTRTHPTFRAIGACFLIFDIGLFISFSLISIVRYTLYPAIFMVMINHETHSLFLGTIPMGFVTIVSGIARTGAEYGLDWTLELAMVLWWIALAMSVFTAFGVPFIMFTKHHHTAEALTAAWLLPVVPPITIAAVGSGLSTLLITKGRLEYALTVVIASYVMNGVGLLIACGLLVIYFQRLAVHHLPATEVIVSTFLPLGPCGQGGFALIELGRVCTKLFPLLAEAYPGVKEYQELSQAGYAMYGSGIMTGLLLWGLGMWWMFMAVMSVATHYVGKTVAFNMGWWAFTFPLGSLTLLTFSLGTTFSSLFFNVIAAIMTFCVVSLWTLVFIPTVIGFFRGTLFPAPCLVSLPKEFVEKFPRAKEKGMGEQILQ